MIEGEAGMKKPSSVKLQGEGGLGPLGHLES